MNVWRLQVVRVIEAMIKSIRVASFRGFAGKDRGSVVGRSLGGRASVSRMNPALRVFGLIRSSLAMRKNLCVFAEMPRT